MKGQFYVLAAFVLGMYIFFILRMFTSTKTSFETPDMPQVDYVIEAIQDSLNDNQDIELVTKTLSYLPDPIGVRCSAYSTGEGSCDLDPDDWACGVNITVVYSGDVDIEATETVYRELFGLNQSRYPVAVFPNETSNLVEVSLAMPISSGTLQDTSGNPVKAHWSGSTLTFRANLIKDKVKTIYVYETSDTGHSLNSDIAVVNGGGYDASSLYGVLEPAGDVENISVSDLSELDGFAGPIMLFIPGKYPPGYANNLKEYVSDGGILVSVWGMCSGIGSCTIGSMESITETHTIAGVNNFSSLNPVSENSNYFSDTDTPFIVYKDTAVNNSRAAIGAISYGEGYVVFVGDEDLLDDTWGQLQDFTDLLVAWGMKPVSTTEVVCPEQSP